jgi:hypothetical protein
MKDKSDQLGWSSASWEGAESATLRDGMRMTFAQKLKWLEEMQAFAMSIQRNTTGSASLGRREGRNTSP